MLTDSIDGIVNPTIGDGSLTQRYCLGVSTRRICTAKSWNSGRGPASQRIGSAVVAGTSRVSNWTPTWLALLVSG